MLQAYEDRAKCFVHQYNQYTIHGYKVQCTMFSALAILDKHECKILGDKVSHFFKFNTWRLIMQKSTLQIFMFYTLHFTCKLHLIIPHSKYSSLYLNRFIVPKIFRRNRQL